MSEAAMPRPAEVYALGQPFRLDPIHLRILQILERDARATVSSIAREVGLTDNAVRYRIRKLRASGVVRRVTVHVDPARLGRGRTAVVLVRLAPGTEAPALRAHHSVALLLPTRGAYQAAALVVAKDSGELDRFVAQLRAEPGVQDVLLLEVSPGTEVPVQPSACTNGLAAPAAGLPSA